MVPATLLSTIDQGFNNRGIGIQTGHKRPSERIKAAPNQTETLIRQRIANSTPRSKLHPSFACLSERGALRTTQRRADS